MIFTHAGVLSVLLCFVLNRFGELNMSYASIVIVGRLGRDPETKMTQTGKELVTASVAVGKDDKTVWYRINAWEKTGQWLKEASKGDMIFAQGSLELKPYQKRTGDAAIDATLTAQVIRLMKSQRSEAIEHAFGGVHPRQAVTPLDDLEIPF